MLFGEKLEVVKTQQVHYVWIPVHSPELTKLKQNNGMRSLRRKMS